MVIAVVVKVIENSWRSRFSF